MRKLSEREFLKRFWDRTYKNDVGCRIWVAAINNQGYGSLGIGNGKTDKAHRVAWKLTFGEIPKGLFVCHKCDVRNCVNPNHLFLGTAAENNHDMAKKGRASKRKGELHPESKLTDAAVIDILTSTLTQTELAKKYGVGRTTIRRAKYGESWKHIERIKNN